MQTNYKKLGTEKISTLLWKQSIPAVVGLLSMSIFNFVDAIFIGQGVGPLGIAGLSVSMPIHMIVMALAQTIGVGSSSIISRALGENKIEKAKSALGNFFTLIIVISILSTVLGVWFLEPLLKIIGATEEIFPYAKDYLSIILLGTVFLAISAGGNNVIRAEGNAKFAMITIVTSAVLNLILDPIFIFGFKMGMKGAAIATVIGFIVSAILVVSYFISGKSNIKLSLRSLIPDKSIVKETFVVGSASFGRQTATSILTIIINITLSTYGTEFSIASYGVVIRITTLVFMPLFGIVQGMLPILGYNFGAKKYERSKEAILKSIKASSIISTIAFIILFIFAKTVSSWFTTDENLISMSAYSLRIVILAMPLLGVVTISGGVFQAIGKGKIGFLLSILRQVVFLIPLIIFLPPVFGEIGVFISMPIADYLATAVAVFFVVKEINSLKLKSQNKVCKIN